MFRNYTGQNTEEAIQAFLFDNDESYSGDDASIYEDARVFAVFVYGAVGMFSESRSLSAGSWRKMPSVIFTADRIGAERLSARLHEAWEEINTFPQDILDDFDSRLAVWEPDLLEMLEKAGDEARPYRAIAEATGERISHLTNYAWQSNIAMTPLSKEVNPKGDSEYRILNALAAYLAAVENEK